MDLGLGGKRALVTGAGRGIGRACAIALAREGAQVTICSRSRDELEDVLRALRAFGDGHAAEVVDLMQADGPADLVAAVRSGAANDPEIVVQNVGGTLDVRDPLSPVARWRDVWRFNVEIAIELSNAFLPAMRERGSGRMIFVSSLAAFEQQGSLAYGVAKAALTAYARGIGRICAPDGVVVSAIVPGVIVTPGGSWERHLKNDPEGVARYVEEKLPRKKFGTAEEIADAVAFLASDRASAFCGSLVPMDGGQGAGTFGV